MGKKQNLGKAFEEIEGGWRLLTQEERDILFGRSQIRTKKLKACYVALNIILGICALFGVWILATAGGLKEGIGMATMMILGGNGILTLAVMSSNNKNKKLWEVSDIKVIEGVLATCHANKYGNSGTVWLKTKGSKIVKAYEQAEGIVRYKCPEGTKVFYMVIEGKVHIYMKP
ncbi:MAG: hypothetical protein ACRCTE_01690 [Cellulosilyticaceae bacterium]